MKITLAIPVLNGERFLGETLKSLCTGSNRHYVSWWLQDAGSTDRTELLARQYKGPSDTVNVEPDTGQANGINRAFAAMGGDIVGYINSDDLLHEGAAEAVIKAFEKHPSADLVYGAIEWIDENGANIGWHQGSIRTLEDALNIYKFWWNRRQWVQPEVFFRRHLYEAVGGFNERYSLAFDFDFWLRVLRLRPIVVSIPKPLVRFRRHNSQRSCDAVTANDEIRSAVLAQLDDPQCPISSSFRTQLRRRVSYDMYQSRSPSWRRPRRNFLTELLQSPQWLMIPEVRERIIQSVAKRLALRGKPDDR